MSADLEKNGRRTSGEERARHEDALWAQHDADVKKRYGGQWVIPFQKQIVAHGTDPQAVLEEGARVTKQGIENLLVCAIPCPDSWLADA